MKNYKICTVKFYGNKFIFYDVAGFFMVAKCNLNIHVCCFNDSWYDKFMFWFKINYESFFRGRNLVVLFLMTEKHVMQMSNEMFRVPESIFTSEYKKKWQLSRSLQNGRQFMSYLNILNQTLRRWWERYITVNRRDNVSVYRRLQSKSNVKRGEGQMKKVIMNIAKTLVHHIVKSFKKWWKEQMKS